LFLTGNSEVEKKITALDEGADDYMVKPFHVKELQARLRALLRRTSQRLGSDVIKVNDVTIDLGKKIVRRGETVIPLRRKEFDLLEYLARNQGKVVTRSMILDHVWDSSYDTFTNIVDVHINYLRHQLDKNFSKKIIKTVHGVGYKLDPSA
jgi:DNA-binding response OmpR family regulator